MESNKIKVESNKIKVESGKIKPVRSVKIIKRIKLSRSKKLFKKVHFNEILESIPEFSKSNILLLEKKLSSLKRVRNSRTDEDSPLFLLYDIIVTKLSKELGCNYLPFTRCKTPLYKKLEEATIYLEKYFQEILVVDTLTQTDMRKGYSLFVNLTFFHFQKHSFPLSLKTIINFYQEFPSLVSAYFPLYIQNKLGHMIIDLDLFNLTSRREEESRRREERCVITTKLKKVER